MKKTKRILCAVLCFIIAVATIGAVSIFAAEEETVEAELPAAEEEVADEAAEVPFEVAAEAVIDNAENMEA